MTMITQEAAKLIRQLWARCFCWLSGGPGRHCMRRATNYEGQAVRMADKEHASSCCCKTAWGQRESAITHPKLAMKYRNMFGGVCIRSKSKRVLPM